MTKELNIDLKIDNHAWANVEVRKNSCLVGMYEDGKIAKALFAMDREQAAQLVKVLDAFTHEWL